MTEEKFYQMLIEHSRTRDEYLRVQIERLTKRSPRFMHIYQQFIQERPGYGGL